MEVLLLRARHSVLFQFSVEELAMNIEQASRLSSIAVGFFEGFFQ